MNINKVYEKIQENNIKVLHFGLPNIKSVSVETNNKYGIFINHKEIENSDEEFMVLAHEWGHYASGTLHGLSSGKTHISQCEYRADRKAVLEFLPFERIQDAIKNGCQTPYEFSEFLDMPEKFVLQAFNHYKNMGLI